MIARRILSLIFMVAAPAFLGGCVVGQSLPAAYETGPAITPSGSTVAVTVHDERPFVKSGDKPPYFIGKYRGGFGNPWDVTTEGKQPLADLLQRDLTKELQALGHAVVPTVDAGRMLDVAVRDWNFDGLMDGKFWYVLEAKVLGRDGGVLAQSTVQDSQFIEGSFWTGAKAGFEATMPELYAAAIRKLVRENPQVSAALATVQVD